MKRNILLLIALTAVLSVGADGGPGGALGYIVAMQGPAPSVLRGGATPVSDVKVNTEIRLHDRIKTAADSKLKILFNDDSVLNIGPRTDLVIDESFAGKRPSAISLSYGKLRAVVSKSVGARADFQVSTKTAVVGVKGTDFILIYPPVPGEGYGATPGCVDLLVLDGIVNIVSGGNAVDILPGRTGQACDGKPIVEGPTNEEDLEDGLEDTTPGTDGNPGFDPNLAKGFFPAGYVPPNPIYNLTYLYDQPNEGNPYEPPSGPTGPPTGPTGPPTGPTGPPTGPTGPPTGPTGPPTGPTGPPTGPTGPPTGPTGPPTGPTGPPTGPTGPSWPGDDPWYGDGGSGGYDGGSDGYDKGGEGYPSGPTGQPSGPTGFPSGPTLPIGMAVDPGPAAPPAAPSPAPPATGKKVPKAGPTGPAPPRIPQGKQAGF